MRRHCQLVANILLLITLSANTTPCVGESVQRAQRRQNERNTLPVVYTQHVRRLPPEYPDDEYVEEILEVFDLKNGPPTDTFTDDDIDRMIRCDFDPTLKECELLRKPVTPARRAHTKSLTTPASSHVSMHPTYYTTTTTTTTRKPFVYERTTPRYTTTTTSSTRPHTTTTTTKEYKSYFGDISEIASADDDERLPDVSNENYDGDDNENYDADDAEDAEDEDDVDNEVGDVGNAYNEKDDHEFGENYNS